MASFNFKLPTAGLASTGSNLETNLYSNTRDADLTYGGNDPAVWDRINAERLRRGLPGLAAIGFPRPPEDETPTASTVEGGQTFEVKGPPGMTYEQAKAIFDQQVAAGSFVGFKPGDVLNSATQAAAGLPGAAAQLAQSLSGTSSILNGSVINNAIGQISGQASQAVNQAVSVAKQAVNTVTGVLSKVPVTNGINVADFTKQIPSLSSIGSLTSVDVRAGMAQASKLVGQAADKITDSVGVGKFGFDATQLEAAGVLKPGIAAKFLEGGANSLTSVLKSPTVFTGKDGIKSLTDLLGSETKQAGIQQNLMAQGLNGLKQVGIPVDKLNPSALAGTVLNAAKNLPATAEWAKGLPLPGDLKSKFDTVSRDAAFAVDFANQKVNDSLKQEIVPAPASDTVNRETLNAAASRVVGSAKVPPVSFNNTPKVDILKFGTAVNKAVSDIADLNKKARDIIKNTPDDQIPQAIRQLEQVIGDYNTLDSKFLALLRDAKAVEAEINTTPPQVATIESQREFLAKIVKALEDTVAKLKQKLENSTA